jgi:hypothetical protein
VRTAFAFPKTFLRSGWTKTLGVACAIVACDPFTTIPPGNCGDVPACSAYDYRIELYQSPAHLAPDSVTGAWPVDSLGFSINVRPGTVAAQVACHGAGRRGVAYALSCAPCSGPYLVVDSLYFTTDILLLTGETLQAGHNFAQGASPVGFSGGGGFLRVRPEFQTRFRDSLFEVRFTGSAGGVPKSAAATLHIRNPALLIP